MFRLPSWKHHWNPSSFPQVHEPTKGRPRNATHESRPVDAQESRALRNPVQSNSWVHEFRWEFLGEIMENHGKLSWENHGKSMGNDGNLFSGHLFLDEIPHVKKYGIPSTSPRGRTRCLPYAKKKHLLFIHHFWRWNPPCHWLNAFLLASNSSKPFVVHRWNLPNVGHVGLILEYLESIVAFPKHENLSH